MPNLFYKTKHKYQPKGGTVIEGASQTIQGEVRSIKELVRRAMEGYPIPTKRVFYFDQENLDLINRYQAPHQLDLTDLDALDAHIQTLQNKVEEARILQTQLDIDKTKIQPEE